MALDEAKLGQVSRIFAMAPDPLLYKLERVLADGRRLDATLAPVHDLAAKERRSRGVMSRVFEPLLPLTAPTAAPTRQLITRQDLAAAWRAGAEADPHLAERIAHLAPTAPDEAPPVELNTLCALAAEAVPGDSAHLKPLLRMTPVLRSLAPRLEDWVDNLSGENSAALRVAFKDAVTVDEDAGPLFWEAVFTYLQRPWTVIRLISAVIDRPSDRYLAESELASLGERLLVEVETCIAALKQFDPIMGEPAAQAAANAAAKALAIAAEFEDWLALRRDGPWGARIAGYKQAVSQIMEARMREAETAVAAALPTQSRGLGKGVRPHPKLNADPQPLLTARAEGLLALLERSRGSAQAGGFASARAKVIEALERRLGLYCDDLLEMLHHKGEPVLESGPDELRIREYLEVAASLIRRLQGESAAAVVRRRIAAA